MSPARRGRRGPPPHAGRRRATPGRGRCHGPARTPIERPRRLQPCRGARHPASGAARPRTTAPRGVGRRQPLGHRARASSWRPPSTQTSAWTAAKAGRMYTAPKASATAIPSRSSAAPASTSPSGGERPPLADVHVGNAQPVAPGLGEGHAVLAALQGGLRVAPEHRQRRRRPLRDHRGPGVGAVAGRDVERLLRLPLRPLGLAEQPPVERGEEPDERRWILGDELRTAGRRPPCRTTRWPGRSAAGRRLVTLLGGSPAPGRCCPVISAATDVVAAEARAAPRSGRTPASISDCMNWLIASRQRAGTMSVWSSTSLHSSRTRAQTRPNSGSV